MSTKYLAVSWDEHNYNGSVISEVMCIGFHQVTDAVHVLADYTNLDDIDMSSVKVHCSWGVEYELAFELELRRQRQSIIDFGELK